MGNKVCKARLGTGTQKQEDGAGWSDDVVVASGAPWAAIFKAGVRGDGEKMTSGSGQVDNTGERFAHPAHVF